MQKKTIHLLKEIPQNPPMCGFTEITITKVTTFVYDDHFFIVNKVALKVYI